MSQARTIGVMTALNIVGAVFAFVNSIVQANLFGTTRAIENYFAATTLLTIITNLSQSGVLASIFLPLYHKIRKEQGLEVARGAFSALLNWSILASSIVLLALWLIAPLLMSLLLPGFGAEDRALATTMFRWLLPLVPLTIAYSFLTTLANAERQFGKPEATRVAQRVVGVLVTIGLYFFFGVWALVWALWASKATGFLGQFWIMHRVGLRYRPKLSQAGFSVRSVFGHMAHTLASSGASQVYSFSLTSALSLLPQGHFAVFKYVFQLYNHLQMAVLRPVSIVFFTQISEAVAAASKALKPIMRRALGQMLAIWSLLIPAVVTGGEPILEGLWGGAVFGASEVDLAAQILVGFLLTFPLLAPNQLNVYTNLSVDAVRAQYTVNTLAGILAAGYVWLFIPNLGIWGAVAIIGLNAAVKEVSSAAILWSRRGFVLLFPRTVLTRLPVAIAAGIGTGMAVPLMIPLSETPVRFELLLSGSLTAVASMIATGVVAWVLRVREFRQVVARIEDFLRSTVLPLAMGNVRR